MLVSVIQLCNIIRLEQMNFMVSNEWNWQKSQLPVKRCSAKKEENGSATFQFVNADPERILPDDVVQIQLDKDFHYQEQFGYVWHKSWNIPEIKITVDEFIFEELQYLYKQVICEVMVVYPCKQGKLYFLHQVGLKGNPVKRLQEPVITIKNLKFSSTSFNYSKNKFSILVWISAKDNQGEMQQICSIISTPIHVDSRKQARKKQEQIPRNFELASPQVFFAPIQQKWIKNLNSLSGFVEYFGAQNIRNKIKHIFHSAYHFSNVFWLFCQTVHKQNLENLLEKVSTENQNQSNKFYLWVVLSNEDQQLRKKAKKIIQKWKFFNIQIVFQGCPIPSGWQMLKSKEIKQGYQKFYNMSLEKAQLDGQEGQKKQQQKEKESNQKKPRQKPNTEIKYQLRTIIDLSQPRKRVKKEEELKKDEVSIV